MPSPAKPARERIIDAANRLFYQEGIRAVSVDAVAEKAGTTKKTLYYHFKSKDDLITAYLTSRDQPNLALYEAWYKAASGEAGDKVEAIFLQLAQSAPTSEMEGMRFPAHGSRVGKSSRSSGYEGGSGPQEKVRSLAGRPTC